MKKLYVFLFLAVFICGGLWGAGFSLSTGAGGLMGGFFTRYSAGDSSGSGEMTQKINQFSYGGLVFFDATYGELAVIIRSGSNSYNEVMTKNGVLVPRVGDGWETSLGFSLLGKYPFTLTERFSLFPLLGLEYQVALSEKRRPDGGVIYDRSNGIQEPDSDGGAYDVSAWNSFWINLGVGLDFSVMKSFFVRGELLYGFRLMTEYEKDGFEQLKTVLGDSDPEKGGLTSGPSLRLSLGYRFRNL